MELVLDFNELNVDELDMLDGGCWVCKAGGVISGTGTGAATVMALASNPAGWAIGLGALAGAGLGYLATR